MRHLLLKHALLALILPLVSTALAQATWTVQTLIPEMISIRVSTTEINFDLSFDNYPPPQFPAQYPAIQPEGGVLPVQIFSSAEGTWNLLLEIPDLQDELGVAFVPAQQILYRVNEGLWLRGNGAPQIIYTGNGPTGDWLEIRVEFALELSGAELGGAYEMSMRVTALTEGGGF